MTISAVADLYARNGYIRTITDATAIKRVGDIVFSSGSSTIEKITSQDQKNTLVSDSAADKNSAQMYDFRFMPNVPLSRPLETSKTFNEPQKANKKEKEEDQKSFSEYFDDNESEPLITTEETTGKGYYIVLNDQTPPPEKKTSFTSQELWQERIMQTYRLSRMKANGTLVNLTF